MRFKLLLLPLFLFQWLIAMGQNCVPPVAYLSVRDQFNCMAFSNTGQIEAVVGDTVDFHDYRLQWFSGTSNDSANALTEATFGGSSTLGDLKSGFYTLEAKDTLTGCINLFTRYVSEAHYLTPEVKVILNCDGPNSSAEVVRIPPFWPPVDYIYTWFDSESWGPLPESGPKLAGLDTGTYLVQVMDPVSSCVQTIYFGISGNQDLTKVDTVSFIKNQQFKCGSENFDGSIEIQLKPGGENPFVIWYRFYDSNGSFIQWDQSINSVSGLKPGSYWAEMIDNVSGCSVSMSTEIYFVPLFIPQTMLVVTPQSACSPSAYNAGLSVWTYSNNLNPRYDFSVTESPTPLNSGLQTANYAWNNLPEGKYTIVTTDPVSGCADSTTTIIPAKIVQPMIETVSVTSNTTCGKAEGSLEVMSTKPGQNSDYTFSWYKGGTPGSGVKINGESSATISGLVTGDYSVVAINKSTGCSSDPFAKNISCVTAIEKEADDSIQIFPNPGADDVHISFPNPDFSKTIVSIINTSGQIQKTIETYSTELIISRGAMASGMYIVMVSNANQTNCKKLVLK